jgi:glycerophosphoryl diester phosphodiesterase
MADYPENTTYAFRSSAPSADIVECDVQRCGSGELVAFHDATLDRVTGRGGRVGATDWSTLEGLSVHGSGERIPRLHEVFEAVPEGTTVVVELKSADIASSVVDVIGNVAHDVILSSFDWTELRAAGDAGASALALLCHDGPGRALDIAERIGCSAIHPAAELCLETDLVERAHSRGLAVHAWTAESPAEVDQLRAAGVDGASTNRVSLLDYIRDSGD